MLPHIKYWLAVSHVICHKIGFCFVSLQQWVVSLQVIDIGSGRGYLGCQMALMYGLKVLGIDSSETNTESAGTRAGKLGKQWEGLVRNAQVGNAAKTRRRKEAKGSKERTKSQLTLSQSKDEDIPDLSLVFNDETSRDVDCEKNTEITGSDNSNQKCFVSKKTANSSCIGGCHVCEINNVDTNEKTDNIVKVQSKVPADVQSAVKHEGQHVQATTYQEDVCCETPVDKRQNVPTTTYQDPRIGTSESKRQGENAAYVAITCYVTPDLSLKTLFDTHSAWSVCDSREAGASGDQGGTVLISGLHTCGNLAASTLQLFCSSDVATVACNVGCCYHLLDEEFLASPFTTPEGWCIAEQSKFTKLTTV